MKLAELTQSTAFRLAAAFTCLFAAAVLIVFMVLYVQVGRELELRLGIRLNATKAEFLKVHQRDGFNELAGLVADDAAVAADNESIFLLKGPEGDYVAGNVRGAQSFDGVLWVQSSELTGLTGSVPPEQRYLAQWVPLPGDGLLLVGFSDAEIRRTRDVLLRALSWGLAGTVLLALGSGIFLGQRAQNQIDRVGHTLTAIRRGELTARVPVEGTGGDIDVVSRQINGTLDQLQSLFESVKQSSADIAHDLKTPIGRLRQRLEGLQISQATPAEAQQVIDTAIIEVDSIVDTFEALLNITQIEAGARKARFRIVDVAGVVASVHEAYEAVAEDAGMSLTLARPGMVAALVRGDNDLLSQMLVNLIENALRHCPPGTHIQIGVTATAQGPQLAITDDGPGIPEGERENVFRRLYRLEKSRTTPGSGLGLALVKAVAELHGATIALADNHPGLRVIIAFPRFAQG